MSLINPNSLDSLSFGKLVIREISEKVQKSLITSIKIRLYRSESIDK